MKPSSTLKNARLVETDMQNRDAGVCTALAALAALCQAGDGFRLQHQTRYAGFLMLVKVTFYLRDSSAFMFLLLTLMLT